MAPRHHCATRHVAGSRVELATRTIFNVLGPISNPSGVKRQLTGVYSKDLIEPIAHALKNLGTERTWVVHGSDGTDELTTTGHSFVAALEGEEIYTFQVSPSDAGLPEAKLSDLKGGDGEYNAAAIRKMLDGHQGPYRDVVLFNTAAALIIADKARDLKEGVRIAADAIDSGRAKEVLAKMIEITNSIPENSRGENA